MIKSSNFQQACYKADWVLIFTKLLKSELSLHFWVCWFSFCRILTLEFYYHFSLSSFQKSWHRFFYHKIRYHFSCCTYQISSSGNYKENVFVQLGFGLSRSPKLLLALSDFRYFTVQFLAFLGSWLQKMFLELILVFRFLFCILTVQIFQWCVHHIVNI